MTINVILAYQIDEQMKEAVIYKKPNHITLVVSIVNIKRCVVDWKL